MNSGNRRLINGLLACTAMLATNQAGRVGEDGSGAMWIAPELLAPELASERCAATYSPLPEPPLVFETIELSERSSNLVRHRRQIMAFEWNSSTGELSIVRSPAAALFQMPDKDAAVPPNVGRSSLKIRSCGSS